MIAKVCLVQVLIALLAVVNCEDDPQRHHHHHHRHHRQHHNSSATAQSASHEMPLRISSAPAQKFVHSSSAATQSVAPVHDAHGTAEVTAAKRHARIGPPPQVSDKDILKMKNLESEIDSKKNVVKVVAKGHLNVNGPLPSDFSDRFAQGVADATGCSVADVQLLGAVPKAVGNVEEIMFESRSDIVAAVEDQAANPESKLANGVLHTFLVAKDEEEEEEEGAEPEKRMRHAPEAPEVDMSMPYGDLEPFGREDTAQELTESSIRESNAMVDQLERAEVAEEKRAVFRALTRLRGAAITSYDGIARSQTGNVDDYARNNQWRKAHPIHHLADDEADVSKWAFPDDAQD